MLNSKGFLRLVLCLVILLAPIQVSSSGIGKGVVAYEPQVVNSAAVDLTAIASTSIVNVTEAGILLSIGFFVTTVPDGTPTVTIDITVDGGTTRSIALYTAALTWATSFRALAARSDSDTGAASDVAALILNVPYKTSLLVGIDVATATSSTGALMVSVLRGVQL